MQCMQFEKCYISGAHSLGEGLGRSGGGPPGLSLEPPGRVHSVIKKVLTIIMTIWTSSFGEQSHVVL